MPRDFEVKRELPLPIAAQRARLSWHAGLRLILTGQWDARKDESGRWAIDEASLDRWLSERDAKAAAGAR